MNKDIKKLTILALIILILTFGVIVFNLIATIKFFKSFDGRLSSIETQFNNLELDNIFICDQ
jgi:ABC-type phosphate transport system permease subunit